MKFLVELDYNPEVLDSDVPKQLKSMLEWSIKGLKVNQIYSTTKLDNTFKEEIMEDKTQPSQQAVAQVSCPECGSYITVGISSCPECGCPLY